MFSLGDKVICKGTMDGRRIEGQRGTISHIYDQQPPRFCIVTFDNNFDTYGKQWDIFYEQLVLANLKFKVDDLVIAVDGKQSVVTGITNEGIYLDENKWYCPNEQATLLGRKVLI